jgi:tRNA nucleotidyltransferase (CCA-adding enzyme)
MELDDILKEVRSRRFPTEVESIQTKQKAQALMEDVAKVLKDTSGAEGIEPMLVGSIAKGTFLKNPDIDVFLRFPGGTSFEVIEGKGLEIARKVLPDGVEKYAQHPYIAGEFQGLEADIVPCIEIQPGDQVVSAVDRTPLHCEFVIKNLNENQHDDVMLLKSFTKGVGVYGANEEFLGLSGYLCELLVIYYGDFTKVLEAVRKWKTKERLVMPGHEEAGQNYDTPLVFIDPTDSGRNVAQAVSEESFNLFITASVSFIAEPKTTFFFPNEPQLLEKEKVYEYLEHNKIVGMVLKPPQDILRDHLFGQVRKTQRSLEKVFVMNDIPVSKAKFYIKDNAYILLSYEPGAFQREILHKGPPEGDLENVEKFKLKWDNNPNAVGETFTRDGHIHVFRKPTYSDPEALIVNSLESISWGKDLKDTLEEMEIRRGKDTIELENGELVSFFIQDRFPWEY